MKIYFVRHGQTDNAAQGLTQEPESGLSNKGIEQAEKLAEMLNHHQIDRIFCSTYRRAKETADIINKNIKVKLDYLDELREVSKPTVIWGKKEDDPRVMEIKRQVYTNFGKKNSKVSDEENFFDLKERGSFCLTQLKSFGIENVLVVSHGTIIRMIVALMMFGQDVSYDQFSDLLEFFGIDNTGVSVCIEGGYRDWKLITWNHTSHLQ